MQFTFISSFHLHLMFSTFFNWFFKLIVLYVKKKKKGSGVSYFYSLTSVFTCSASTNFSASEFACQIHNLLNFAKHPSIRSYNCGRMYEQAGIVIYVGISPKLHWFHLLEEHFHAWILIKNFMTNYLSLII